MSAQCAVVAKLCWTLVAVVGGALVLCQLVSPQVALVRERGLAQVALPSDLVKKKLESIETSQHELPAHVWRVCAF